MGAVKRRHADRRGPTPARRPRSTDEDASKAAYEGVVEAVRGVAERVSAER